MLIKENHITNKLISYEDFLKKINKKISFREVSIEVETLEELKILIQYKPKNVLLDNFSLLNIKKASKIINKNITSIEISGNINIKNIDKYSCLDIDFISIGDLTKNIRSIDLSMLIEK